SSARRSAAWLVGCALVAGSAIGPLADAAHHDATAHMVVHLLAGMAAPLLLVLAAPTTLALRALATVQARRLSRLLRSRLVRVASHPCAATTLHVGTMWALYGTQVGRTALHDPVLHAFVLLHLVATGSLFAWSLVGVDPSPHRARLGIRVAALVAGAAAHRILAVHLYAEADLGATEAASRVAARVMSAGGDVVELALAIVLFAQWHRRGARASGVAPRSDVPGDDRARRRGAAPGRRRTPSVSSRRPRRPRPT
ncbi:cytochrome c oxidase assembly protein, partial [Burkholderia cenocepacia]|uniref:cytochrome c oxidase assembly protein n=1 Tax=Burkholderia cenocepacia TaxID=95486 RepID=UPI0038CBF74D